MPTQRTSLNVSLTPELSAFIAAQLSSGRYQSASEVVRAALRLFQEAERTKPSAATSPHAAPRTREARA
jgi:antitoxin ParD1/3/4